MKTNDSRIRTSFNANKLYATAAYHSGWGSSPDGEKYTFLHLATWFAAREFYIDRYLLKRMVLIVEATWWFGTKVRRWIDGYFPSTQHEIAFNILKILKKNPVNMDAKELETARKVVQQIMDVLGTDTSHDDVVTKLQEAELLPKGEWDPTDPSDPAPRGFEATLIKRLRLTKDGKVCGIQFGRFEKGSDRFENHLTRILRGVMDIHEGITRDRAFEMLFEAGAEALGVEVDDDDDERATAEPSLRPIAH
jgi:hypothetical protein